MNSRRLISADPNPRPLQYSRSGLCIAAKAATQCPLMGWSGRAPAPPAREAGKGHQRRGARHVTQAQFCNRRDRFRYRQELISRHWSEQARRDHASAEVVAAYSLFLGPKKFRHVRSSFAHWEPTALHLHEWAMI